MTFLQHPKFARFFRPVKYQSTHVIFLILCGTVIFMATYRLADCRLWIDETFSILIAQRTLSEIWSLKPHINTFYWNTMPPLYETLLHFVWHPSGNRELVARCLSIIFSLSALCGIFRLTKKLYDPHAALIAATLAGFNYMFLLYAQMIRGYALFNMLSIWSFYFFFTVFLRKKLSLRSALTLLILNAALLYVSYLGTLAILFQVFFSFFVSQRNTRRQLLIIMALAVILFLPWSGHFLADAAKEPGVSTNVGSLSHMGQAITFRLSEGVFRSIPLMYVYLSITVICSVMSGVALWRNRDSVQCVSTLFLAAICIISLWAITFVCRSFVTEHDANRARYYFPYLFPIFILTGSFFRRLPSMLSAGLLACMLFLSLNPVYAFLRAPKDSYWPEGIYVAAEMIKDYPFPPRDRIAIEINEGVMVPPFMFSLFGPQFFYETSVPYHGSNLKRRFIEGNNEYGVFCNYGGKIRLHSIPRLASFDWLCLVSEITWPVKPLRAIYLGRLHNRGMSQAVRLVEHKEWNAVTLDIYKILSPADYIVNQTP